MGRLVIRWGELRELRTMLWIIVFIAIWLRLGMIAWSRIPNAPFPYNSGGRNLVSYYATTALEQLPFHIHW